MAIALAAAAPIAGAEAGVICDMHDRTKEMQVC